MPANSKIYNEEIFYPNRKMANDEKKIYDFLDKTIVGQTGPKKSIASKLSSFGTNPLELNLPACKLLFVGPSGCGKDEMIKAISYFIYEKEDAITTIDCENPNPYFLLKENYTRFSKKVEESLKLYKYTLKRLYEELEPAEIKEKENPKDQEVSSRVKILKEEILETRRKVFFLESKTLNGIAVPIIIFENIDKAGPAIFNTLMCILKRGRTVEMIQSSRSLSVEMVDNYFSNALIIITISGNPTQVAEYFKKNGVLNKGYPSAGFSGLPLKDPLNLIQVAELIGKENIIFFRKLKEKEIIRIIDKKLGILSSNLRVDIDFTDAFREFLFKEATTGLHKDKGAYHIDTVIWENIQNQIEKLNLSMSKKNEDNPLHGKSLIFDRIITGKQSKKEETVTKILSLSPDPNEKKDQITGCPPIGH